VCPPDTPLAVMKPDIVFFGESLPEEFHDQMAQDKDECDLLFVIGSSLKVRPVALIPSESQTLFSYFCIYRAQNITGPTVLLSDCDHLEIRKSSDFDNL